MRRDYFELAVEHVGWVSEGGEPRKPTVHIDFRGPEELLRGRLTDVEGNLLDAEETDVSFRLHDDVDAPDVTGVVAVTNRLTGDFVLELNEEADDVLTFIRAAREYGRATDELDGRYRVNISIDDEHVVSYEKSTFLVYDAEGNLLRGRSLIPSGVEL
jgi:hypothetical protein